MSQDIAQVRQEIHEMLARIESGITHYELLGVDREADRAAVSRQFRQLARQWHVDRFSQYDLGDDKQKIQQIFSAINTANQVLTNDAKRQDYDAELDHGGDAGADLSAIFKAETLFVRGKTLLQQGNYQGAANMFDEALSLTPDDESIRIYNMYAEYHLMPKSQEGKPLKITRAQEIFAHFNELLNDDADNDWLLTATATIALGLGETRKANRFVRDALMVNSDNRDAQRLKRLIQMRTKKDEESKGWWAKLRERFGG